MRSLCYQIPLEPLTFQSVRCEYMQVREICEPRIYTKSDKQNAFNAQVIWSFMRECYH